MATESISVLWIDSVIQTADIKITLFSYLLIIFAGIIIQSSEFNLVYGTIRPVVFSVCGLVATQP
jgi:hypothetical protein